jgi:hypothetical protein
VTARCLQSFPGESAAAGRFPLSPETIMPQGDKGKYTDKQKRKAGHIEQGYRDKGVSEKEAAARAWATVNAQDGGGKKSGSGRKPAPRKASK